MSDKPTIIINSPSHKDTNESYANFKAEMEGSIMCGCDHGCNQWLARNSAKALAMMNELETVGMSGELDDMAKRPANEYGRELFQRIRDKHTNKRKAMKALKELEDKIQNMSMKELCEKLNVDPKDAKQYAELERMLLSFKKKDVINDNQS